MRSHYSNELESLEDGSDVILAGWVHEVRDLGRLKFILLRDRGGLVQVTAKKGVTGESVLNSIDSYSKESVVQVKGTVKRNKQAPGGIEVFPSEVNLIASSVSPLPLDVTGKVPADLDTRLNSRFMDVRRPGVGAIFKIRSKVQEAFREFLIGRGFIEINPPSIIAAASEGGTDLFAITYFEKEAFLAQSPQLYKQMLMGSGFDKVMITMPVFRAELHNTTKHLNEVYQMDIEKAYIKDEEDVLEELEGVTHHIFSKVSEECGRELEALGRDLNVPELPFQRITYDEVLSLLDKKGLKLKWGSDLTTEAEKLICSEFKDPFFITHWPTEIRAFYSRPLDGNPKICGAFDMLYSGLELASGAQRIHDVDQLVQAIKSRGLNPDNFEFYLKAFRYGMPPHGGWSIGAERITETLTGVDNIRECVLFPRDRTRLTP